MRYRLLYGLVISSVISVAVAIFSQQPVMAANAVPPEHIFCTAVAAEIRDHKVDGEVYKACFYQGKQVNVERITCPTGSFEEVSGSVTNSTVVRRCVSSAPRCEDGLKEVNGRCVDTKKNREETFHVIKDRQFDNDPVGKKAYASFQSNCRGNSECLNTDYDKFLRTYFADQVYLCMQPAATAAQQAKTELGLQGGTAPDEVFANCLKKTYPSINAAALRKQAKEIDFINSLATINQKTTSDKITDKPAEDGPQGENAEAERSCGENLEGLGWVICPAMSLGSAAADGAMEVLKQLLDVRPQLLDKDSGTYQAWTYFRNLANIVFVILFLWVIFSQMTSVGITNYGIKKVLPRLIIGAVLVNLSYYIAQIAVDVSNILGYSLEQMFQQAAKEIGGSNPDAIHSSLTWVSWAGTALVSTAIVTAVVVLAGGSVLLASLLAIAVVLAILITRQAVVILLVAISPLAFAAWLLPNTEQLFKRWLGLMKAMLAVFPVISLLYGASSLASSVLMKTATQNPNGPSWLLQLSALAVLFLPLGATPFVLRSSLNSLGTIGQKLGNLSDKANRRIGGKVKESSRLGEAWKGMKYNRALKRAERRAGGRGVGGIIDNSPLGRRLRLDQGKYEAQQAVDKVAEENAERKLSYEYRGDAVRALQDGDAKVRAAAAKQLAGQGEWGANQLATYLSNGGVVDSIAMANHLTTVKSAHAGVAAAGTAALTDLQSGANSYKTDVAGLKQFTSDGIAKMTNEQILNQSPKAVEAAIQGGGITGARASEILADPELQKELKPETKAQLQAIAQPVVSSNSAPVLNQGANFKTNDTVATPIAPSQASVNQQSKTLQIRGFTPKDKP